MTFISTYFERVNVQKRDENISKLWPADSLSVIMRPAQGFEFDLPVLNVY